MNQKSFLTKNQFRMSKISSNNYKQAVKEITAMDPDQANRIPETINARDGKHFHVALVRITDRPGQPKNDVNVNVQQYHRSGFDKISKSFVFQGFSKLVIVHDPRKPISTPANDSGETADGAKVETGTTTPPAGQTDGKTAENASTGNESDSLEQEFQFAIGGNKPELIAFAEKHGVDLSKANNNPERVQAITEWFNAKMESLNPNE